MYKMPKYLKDECGRMYRIVGYHATYHEFESNKFVFDCYQVDLSKIDFSTNYVGIKKVIFNDPATIVMWADGTKTVVKCQPGDIYDKRTGLLLCVAKKMYGNKNKFNDILNKWCPEEDEYGPCMTDEEWNAYKEYCEDQLKRAVKEQINPDTINLIRSIFSFGGKVYE